MNKRLASDLYHTVADKHGSNIRVVSNDKAFFYDHLRSKLIPLHGNESTVNWEEIKHLKGIYTYTEEDWHLHTEALKRLFSNNPQMLYTFHGFSAPLLEMHSDYFIENWSEFILYDGYYLIVSSLDTELVLEYLYEDDVLYSTVEVK